MNVQDMGNEMMGWAQAMPRHLISVTATLNGSLVIWAPFPGPPQFVTLVRGNMAVWEMML